MTVERQPVSAAMLEEILSTPALEYWLDDAYERFVQIVVTSAKEVSVIQDVRTADQELVAAGRDMEVMFLGFGGYLRLVPGTRPCYGTARPSSVILSPGELCGEYEAGIDGHDRRPFGWSIFSLDREAGVLRFEPALVKRLFSVPEISSAILRQHLAWSNEALHRGCLPRWQRELASAANLLVRACAVGYDDTSGPIDVGISKSKIAKAIGCNRRRMDQIFAFLAERDLIEVQQTERWSGTRCRIRSLRALREVEYSGCDPRQDKMVPADGYKRRRDLASYAS